MSVNFDLVGRSVRVRRVRDFIKGLGIEATPYSFRNRFSHGAGQLGRAEAERGSRAVHLRPQDRRYPCRI
jgi:hypothetical protein